MSRLDDDQVLALFCDHWLKTKDLRACLRLVRDADRHGPAQAIARAGAYHRHAERSATMSNMVERSAMLERGTQLLRRFARAKGVPFTALVGRNKTKTVSRDRHEGMFLLRELLEMSYPEIALVAGGRGHTDAIYGVRKVERRIADEPELRTRLRALVQPEKRRAA